MKLPIRAMRIIQSFIARGHPNIAAKHSMTFEITKDDKLTKRGDCVIAVGATKGLTDLSSEFRNLCRSDESRITIELGVAGIIESIEGAGSSQFTLSHSREIVGRKSTYISDRTFMIHADKAARDINRDLIYALKSPETTLKIKLIVESS
jgi:hypothetical protein